MQPLHCDLQPESQQTHRITHTLTTTRCRTQRRNRSRPVRAQPHPPHTRGTFHRRPEPLYPKKTQGFLPRLSPKTKPMQHPCSHYNAFSNIRTQTCISRRTWQHKTSTIMQPLHCDLQPESQQTHRITHTLTTTRCRTQRRNRSRPVRAQPHPPHTRGTFHRWPEPLYPKKTQGFLPRLSPKTKPMQHPCSHYNVFRNIRTQTRISRRTWQHKTTTIMQPLHCDLQPECKLTHHHSLSIVSHFSSWCDVNSHTTIHWVLSDTSHCDVMSTLTPPFIEYSLTLLIVMWFKLSHHHSLSIVSHFSLWCDAK